MRKNKKPSSAARRHYKPSDESLFKRSRTLTGSKSSYVRAANEETGSLQSDRLKRQRLRRKQRMALSALGIVVVIIGSIFYLINQYIFSVGALQFAPGPFLTEPPSSSYSQSITSYIQTHPSDRFRFALKEDKLSEYVNKEHPEVEKVKKSNNSFEVTLRQPVAVWKVGSQENYVDANGEAFAKNYYPLPAVSVDDVSGATSESGEVVASKRFLSFLGRLVALTNVSGLGTVAEASLPPNTTRQIDIKIEGRGYLIKTHTDRDPAQVVEDMVRVVKYLELKSINPSYIDVRIPAKAYYR